MAKITKAEMPALAEQIVKCLGGKENVARINHCATRLRVNPVDMEKVDKDGLKRLHGVIGIDSSKAELQIIVGAIIEDLYLEVEKITGNGGGAVADDVPFWKKRPSEIFSNFLLLMAGCLSPVIPALIASGLLATVLTIMTLVLHVDASTSSTYSILYNLSQTVFYFMPVLVAYTSAKKFGTECEDIVVVSPDVGSVARARAFAQKLHMNLAIVDKRRQKANQCEVMNVIGDVEGKECILFDDMVDTAGSLCNAAKAIVEVGGAKKVYACASHGVLSGPALERLEASCIEELALLDTIPAPVGEAELAKARIKYLTVAPMFAEAIERTYQEISIAKLFN